MHGIFLETDEGLRPMSEQPYDEEAVLQEALEAYPEVIAGVSTAEGGPSRLALVRREMGVPSVEGGSQTWSLDHLFVDAEGVPVLVEVKRSSDTRIRREVVGQMLDYAANGLKYWPIEELREAFAECVADDPDAWLEEHFAVTDADRYWQTVEDNLRIGRVRLLFVADRLPSELVRIIEFLNEQMHEAEVLGVELRQFVSDDNQRAFVPTLIGRTSRAVQSKSSGGGGTPWSLDTFMAAAEQRRPPTEVAFIRRLFAHVDERGGYLNFGKGVTPGLSGWYPIDGKPRPVFLLNLNEAAPGREAYVNFYGTELVDPLGEARLEQALSVLETSSVFKQQVHEARQVNYRKWPRAFLPELLAEDREGRVVTDAIDALLDTAVQPQPQAPS